MTHPQTEGWGIIRPGDRRAHYYRMGMSLCRRIGFYSGPLDADAFKSKDDCAACRKQLDRTYTFEGASDTGLPGGAVYGPPAAPAVTP